MLSMLSMTVISGSESTSKTRVFPLRKKKKVFKKIGTVKKREGRGGGRRREGEIERKREKPWQ